MWVTAVFSDYDIENDPSKTAALGLGPTGLPAWTDVLVRLSRAPVISIASIRGRARGAGSEFVLAADLRFASRENSVLGQFEVGMGVVPGGAPTARLSRLVGRGRALEILLVADDFDGPRAEQYGYVNRAIADDRLDDEVDAMASRLASFDHEAIVRTKSYVDLVDAARRERAHGPARRLPRALLASRAAGAVGTAARARAQYRQRPRTVTRAPRGRLARLTRPAGSPERRARAARRAGTEGRAG
jgi:enoyl-CoA hydratase/carnithine racemase